MTDRYYANHIHHSFSMRDIPVGNNLTEAKRAAERELGVGLQEGELVIYDAHTIGFVAVASKQPASKRWANLA